MFQSIHAIIGCCCSSGTASSLWICCFLSVYVRPHEYSIYSWKPCIGYSKLSMNGTSHIISMTSYLFSLREQTSPHSPQNSIVSSPYLGYPRQLTKTQTDVSLFILDLSLIRKRCKLVFPRTRNNGLWMQSIRYSLPHQRQSRRSILRLGSFHTAVRLFPSDVHSYATSSRYYVVGIHIIILVEFVYPVRHVMTSNGGYVSLHHGRQS